MVRAALRIWSPWAPIDGVRWLIAVAVGHVLCLAGWWTASRQPGFNDQFSGAAVSVIGFALVAYGHVSWILRGRAGIVRRRRRRWPLDDGYEPAAVDVRDEGLVVAGEGTRHFHRPGCQFAAGKGWPPVRREEAAVEQRPCGACRP